MGIMQSTAKKKLGLLLIVIGILLGCLLLLYNQSAEKKEAEIFSVDMKALSVGEELLTHFKSIDSQGLYVQTETMDQNDGRRTLELIPLTSVDTLKSHPQIRRYGLRWNAGDGYTILVPSTESFLLTKPAGGCVWNNAPNIFQQELRIAQQVFTNRGFVLDTVNSSADLSDDRLLDYVQAYRKNNDLCKITVDLECASRGGGIVEDSVISHALTVSCGNTLTEAYNEQVPLLDALELKNTNTVAVIQNQSGQFFQVVVRGLRGGGHALLKKEGDTYRVLYSGQEYPSCNLIDKEKIPQEFLLDSGYRHCNEDGLPRELTQ